MALAFRAGSFVSAGGASGDALTINKPTGTVEGDIIVYVVYWETDTQTITPPSGFSSAIVQDNTGEFQLEVFYKRAGASEPANYTFTPSVNGQWRSIAGGAYSGGTGTGSLIDVTGGSQADGVIIADQTAPSVTTTGADRMVTFGYGNFNGINVTAMTGFCTNFRGSLSGTTLGDALKATAGATGTSRPGTGPGTEDYVAVHVAIISDTGGGAAVIITGILQPMGIVW